MDPNMPGMDHDMPGMDMGGGGGAQLGGAGGGNGFCEPGAGRVMYSGFTFVKDVSSCWSVWGLVCCVLV